MYYIILQSVLEFISVDVCAMLAYQVYPLYFYRLCHNINFQCLKPVLFAIISSSFSLDRYNM